MTLLILIALSSFNISCLESKAPNTTTDVRPEVVETVIETPSLPTVSEEEPIEVVKEIPTKITVEPSIEVVEKTEVIKEESVVVIQEEEETERVVKEIEPKIVELVESIEIKEPSPTEKTITTEVEEVVEIEKVDHVAHGDFEAILQKHVKNGLVNYAGIKADGKLEGYLDYLASHTPSETDKSKAALAFWMNAYNAYTIKLITDNYPLESIMDLDGGKVWDRKWIKMGGKTYSLNNIEHDIIRPVFNEPRIHFAVVCAAKSCPPLDNKAFFAKTVDAHLERLTKSFINNPKFNQLTEKKATVTPIFDWYGKDFGSVKEYVRKYAAIDLPEKFKLGFTNYDWSLNEQ